MSDYVVRPTRRRNGALKVQPVDPCLGYYIPLVDDGQSRTDSLCPPDTSNVDTNARNENEQAIQESEGRQPSRSPTTSSLELVNAEWCSFVPAVRPPEAPRIYATPNRHDEPLTVEEFLKRSSRRVYGRRGRTNRQKKMPQTRQLSGQEEGSRHAVQKECDGEEDVVHLRSRRVIRKIVPSDLSSSEMEMDTSPISFDPPTPLSEKKKQRPGQKKKKSLKERIHEAAVATYCDPDPTFLHPEIPVDGSVPLPLRFVPGPEPTRPRKVDKPKKRNWTLVDPRKSMAIRTTTFSSRIRPPNLVFNNIFSPLKGDKRVDTYKLTRLGAPSFKAMDRPSRGKKNSCEFEKLTSEDLALASIACPPLKLVPIHEAGDDYTSLNVGRGVQANQKMKSDSTSALQMARWPQDKKTS